MALKILRQLKGKDLRSLADKYGVTVWTERGTLNKGWVGHTAEAVLGIPPNSSRNPNGGSWELKTASLKRRARDGKLVPKETLAITMINPEEVVNTPFENSHLLAKLRNLVVLARIYENRQESSTHVYSVGIFDLGSVDVYEIVKSDYNLVRETIQNEGFEALSGRMGQYVQPRTKGAGHGTTSRAFYARTGFVKRILGLE